MHSYIVGTSTSRYYSVSPLDERSYLTEGIGLLSKFLQGENTTCRACHICSLLYVKLWSKRAASDILN